MDTQTNAQRYEMGKIDIAWCPGCGNFGILSVLKNALVELNVSQSNLVMVSGIGQAAKIPHYFKTNFFNGLHGRALPAAIGIKASNPGLLVIAESGDGDMYGEGGNHFINTIRRNPDITNIVHDNMVYGLTKGQASPTSRKGFKTPVQVAGVINEPFNPIAVAVALDASFVARAFIGDTEATKEIIKQAISHKGYSLVDIFQPCPSFNKLNSYKWFKENTYQLEESHDPTDRIRAFEKAIETEKMPLGIIYKNDNKQIYEKSLDAYQENDEPIIWRKRDMAKLQSLIDKYAQ
jgi:2-oxoglutarate ferredoxin oxidoreductase subunit beta